MKRVPAVLSALLIGLLGLAACAPPPPPPPVVPLRLLDVWTPQPDTLTPADPVRGWQFAVEAAPLRIRVQDTAASTADLQVTLKDAAGTLLAAGADMTPVVAAGVYTLEVRLLSGDSATYTVLVTYLDRTPVPPSLPTPTATFTRTLTATATFTPSPLPTNPPTITPSLTFTPTPTASHTPTTTFTPSYTFTPSQTFTPSVTFTPSLTPTALWATLGSLIGPIAPGQQAANTLISALDRHVYTLNAQAGTVISAAATGTNPRLAIYDPAGAAIAYDDDSGGGTTALIRGLRLPVTGVYLVQVIDGGIAAGGSAPYHLLILSGDQAAPTPPLPPDRLVIGVPVTETLPRPDSVRRYLVDIAAGTLITLAVRPTPGSAVRPVLEVINPGGDSMIALQPDAAGVVLVEQLSILETGTYTVFITSAGGAGDFVLTYFAAPLLTPTPPPIARLTAADALPPGVYLTYPFSGTAGEVLRVQVTGLEGVDPAAEVLDSAGTVIAAGDDTVTGERVDLNPDFTVTLPADGVYQLRISAYGATGGRIRAVITLDN